MIGDDNVLELSRLYRAAQATVTNKQTEPKESAMAVRNWECCGSHCTDAKSEVRKYPLGGGANLILCRSCWANENRYRADRARDTSRPADFPQEKWETAEVMCEARS
jgi:hypothetical protein